MRAARVWAVMGGVGEAGVDKASVGVGMGGVCEGGMGMVGCRWCW